MHAQQLRDGRWAVRFRSADGRWRRTSGHATMDAALAAAAAIEARNDHQAYVITEGAGDDLYYVGRYWIPAGWQETADGFYTEADALAEALELEQAARDARSGA